MSVGMAGLEMLISRRSPTPLDVSPPVSVELTVYAIWLLTITAPPCGWGSLLANNLPTTVGLDRLLMSTAMTLLDWPK